ncbi:DUF4013 domain-containing protein [bacterium]|jgi:hypothetical protein|nr:DUF4013 domain-containing protein [bacterium]
MKKKIIDAFKEPFKDQESRLNLLIGGVITFFPIINFVSFGFLGKKLENSIEQKKIPVKWDENIKEFFIKGFKIFIICLSYLLLPVLLAFLGGFFILTLAEGKIFSLFYFRGQILNIIATLLFLTSLYFIPFAVCMFLESGDIKKSFDLQENISRISLIPQEYLVIFGLSISLIVVSAVILFFLMNWTFSILLWGFIIFYDSLVITNLLSKFFPRKSISININ